jgi:hypothetical protein
MISMVPHQGLTASTDCRSKFRLAMHNALWNQRTTPLRCAEGASVWFDWWELGNHGLAGFCSSLSTGVPLRCSLIPA